MQTKESAYQSHAYIVMPTSKDKSCKVTIIQSRWAFYVNVLESLIYFGYSIAGQYPNTTKPKLTICVFLTYILHTIVMLQVLKRVAVESGLWVLIKYQTESSCGQIMYHFVMSLA